MLRNLDIFVDDGRPLARGVSACLLDTILLSLDTLISIFFLCIMQWNEKELDTHFTPNVYFWTPNSEILAKALDDGSMNFIINRIQ